MWVMIEMERLQEALAAERLREKNAEQEVAFLLGLTKKVRQDRAQTESRRLQGVLGNERARVQSLEAKLRVEKAQAEGNDARIRAERARAQRLQESLRVAQVGLESAQNELILLQSQSEAFREAISKANSLALKLQERLALSEEKGRQSQRHLGEAKADVERWQMMTDKMQQERDVAQRAITQHGVSRLVENVFAKMHRLAKVHREVGYWMGHYYQAVPDEDRWEKQFIDKEFTQLLNAQLRGGRYLIPMEAVWTRRGLTPGASSSGARPEETPLIGHPVVPPPPGSQNK